MRETERRRAGAERRGAKEGGAEGKGAEEEFQVKGS